VGYLFLEAIIFGQNSVMKKSLVVLFVVIQTALAQAQLGPGEKHYLTNDVQWGLFIPVVEKQNEIQVWGSNHYVYGLTYRNRVAPFLGLGGMFNANVRQYKIRQHDGKFYPDSARWDKQRLTTSSLQLALITRWYLLPSDENEGLFIDLGIGGDMTVYRENFFLDKSAPDGFRRRRERGLKYIAPFTANALFRVSYQSFGAFFSYRLTNMFKPHNTQDYAELPRFSVGLLFGISMGKVG
jgi:hypothetical protein